MDFFPVRYVFLMPLDSTVADVYHVALSVATVTILIRSTFRVAELSQGFDGELANDEVTFLVLEGAMVTIASIALTVAHPGPSFKGQWLHLGFKWRSVKDKESDVAILETAEQK